MGGAEWWPDRTGPVVVPRCCAWPERVASAVGLTDGVDRAGANPRSAWWSLSACPAREAVSPVVPHPNLQTRP